LGGQVPHRELSDPFPAQRFDPYNFQIAALLGRGHLVPVPAQQVAKRELEGYMLVVCFSGI
jgi:hypothetical protein